MQTALSSARCSSLCRTASTSRTNTLCSESTRRPDSCVSLRTSTGTRDRRSTTFSSKLKIQWVVNCVHCKSCENCRVGYVDHTKLLHFRHFSNVREAWALRPTCTLRWRTWMTTLQCLTLTSTPWASAATRSPAQRSSTLSPPTKTPAGSDRSPTTWYLVTCPVCLHWISKQVGRQKKTLLWLRFQVKVNALKFKVLKEKCAVSQVIFLIYLRRSVRKNALKKDAKQKEMTRITKQKQQVFFVID